MHPQDREVKGKRQDRRQLLERPSHLSKCHGSLVLEEGGQGVLSRRKGQGLQADHSLPPMWYGVSNSKQITEARLIALGSARMKDGCQQPMQVGQRSVLQDYRKALRRRSVSDGDESPGQEVGAQGALNQPE